FLAARNTSNRGTLRFGVRKLCQSALNRLAHAFSFGAFPQDPATLAAFEVEINSAQSDGIRVCFRPIDLGESFTQTCLRLATIFQRQQSVLPKPGIGIECATKSPEAVV